MNLFDSIPDSTFAVELGIKLTKTAFSELVVEAIGYILLSYTSSLTLSICQIVRVSIPAWPILLRSAAPNSTSFTIIRFPFAANSHHYFCFLRLCWMRRVKHEYGGSWHMLQWDYSLHTPQMFNAPGQKHLDHFRWQRNSANWTSEYELQ